MSLLPTNSETLATINGIVDIWRSAKSDSLIDYTRVTRVEPVCLIDADALFLDSISEVQQSLLSIFSGYYLQAAAISTTVGRIDVLRHLDKLNPRRNGADSLASGASVLMAMESYKDRLPTFGDKRIALEAETTRTSTTTSTSNNRGDSWDNKGGSSGSTERSNSTNTTTDTTTVKETGSEVSFGRDTADILSEVSNLSVGKMLSVEITDGEHKASIPVAVRLIASTVPSSNLVHILSIGNKDNSVKERYHAWKAGRLSFVKDLIFCQDLIDAHRKNLMKDKDGIYSSIIARQRANQVSTIVSGNPSIATASNIVVMTADTARKLENEIMGKLNTFSVREKVFKETYIMLMAVIDSRYDMVTFYHRGIDGHTEVSVRDLRSSNKGSGPSVTEILKAFSVGNSPSL
jgi:hypothetical protein